MMKKKQYINNWIKICWVGTFFYGLGHGDLHAGNVLFSNNKICLLDFGIAFKINKICQNAIYKFYKELYLENDYKEAANKSLDLFEPLNVINNLSEIKKNEIIDILYYIILKNFIENPDLAKFYYESNKQLKSYGIFFNKDFQNVWLSCISGNTFSINLADCKNQIQYTKICETIIISLFKESDFSLD